MAYATCACKFDEAEDNVIQWCYVHALARDEAVAAEREACAQVAECIEEDAGKAIAAGIRLRTTVPQ